MEQPSTKSTGYSISFEKSPDRSSSILEAVGKLKLEYTKLLDKAIASKLVDEDLNVHPIENSETTRIKKEAIAFSEAGTCLLLKWDSIDLTELCTDSPLRLLRSAQIQKLLQFCNTMDLINGRYNN